ncbi:O-antigen ligase family protein [Hyphomicrobium sp. ghe19]|uniref:O-antigen ligase family protein n=1 Tax=Hyphomicrobium sp. ghe19 TaxID=2682968 RepID=UPI0030D2D7C9
MRPRIENKIFWPVITAITVYYVAKNLPRLKNLPPHIILLLIYLAYAGTSVLWAFNPGLTLTRFVLQSMIVTCIVLPIIMADKNADVIPGIFGCFACAVILNLPIVLSQTPIIYDTWKGPEIIGYPGYFSFKGELGECAAVAFLLSLHELFYRGRRRVIGLIVLVISVYLAIESKSKGSLGMAIISPTLALAVLFIGRLIRTSPALTLLPIPLTYYVMSKVYGNILNRISWYALGNYDLSGRAYIWNFVQYEISKKPILGWGYQSFWLVGPNGPSVLEAPGWIKGMPSGHSGYLDTMLELGYVGWMLLVAFIFATLHAIGRVAERNLLRAWLLLTLALFVILSNFLESIWMRGQGTLWVTFLVVVADAGRYWRRAPSVSRHPQRAVTRV